MDQGSSVPLAKCSFGMIPLSRHPVHRSPRAFHSSTHNVVRASCFEVLSASVESRKLFLNGSLCLAGRWPWSGCLGSSSWRQRSALAATFRRMWGGAIPINKNSNYRVGGIMIEYPTHFTKQKQYTQPEDNCADVHMNPIVDRYSCHVLQSVLV